LRFETYCRLLSGVHFLRRNRSAVSFCPSGANFLRECGIGTVGRHMTPEDASLAALARRCLESGGTDAWAALIARVQPVFARIAYRVACECGQPRSNDLDDVVQEMLLKLGANRGDLLRKLPSNEQSAESYLKVMAANCARDYFRTMYAERRDQRKTVEADAGTNRLELLVNAQPGMERSVLIRQIDAQLETDGRNRTIFWLYYRDGFSAREIAAVPAFGLTAKGVESVIHQLTVALRSKLDRPSCGYVEGDSAAAPS
jgi:RNA polymerase sigma-70 factor, ECF subfamily